MPLQVDILTPKRQAWSGVASEVRAPGWLGEFGVLPGHDSMLSLLRAGVCVISADHGEQRFVVGRGFAEVSAERVTLLTDSAEPVESVDKTAATRDLENAEATMSTADPLSAEWAMAEEKLELARARLSV